jgi:hypothetical protein
MNCISLSILPSQHFHSIVTQSVIHYPIRWSWRPCQGTGVGQILADMPDRNER